MKISLGKTELSVSYWFIFIVLVMLIKSDNAVVMSSLVCAFLHEAGHLFFMCIFRVYPELIYLGSFGMRITRKNSIDVSYTEEIIISLGGIIFNLFLLFFSYVLYKVTLVSFFRVLIYVNMIIIMINSFPSDILDTGRALNLYLLMKSDENRARKIMNLISTVGALAFTAVSLIYCTVKEFNISLIVLSVYLLLTTFSKKWS